MDVGTLLEQAGAYLGPEDLDVIRRACERAEQALQGQALESGEPYIVHALSVAHSLAELGLDASTVAAALLYAAVDRAGVQVEELRQEFGDETVRLIDGMVDLAGLDASIRGHAEQRSDRQTENLRKMFLTMVDDPRVILIKLADRLHHVQMLQAVQDVDRRQRVARETLDIYAPLAGRLGMYRLKWELEDMGFRYVDPQAYADIAERLNERRQDRERQVVTFIRQIREGLEAEGIQGAAVVGRPKHIYSIYKKMQRKQVPFEQIYDVRAVRILVDTVPQCYHALGVIHHLWHPRPGGFDDYIASPKDNSYQSLHTDVIADDGKTLEVQIRTHEMHEVAEFGIAAHWRYKEGGRRANEVYQKKLEWLQSVLVSPRSEDDESMVDVMTGDLFRDQVYVFTPHGETVELPVGATPVDFAYAIHTEVGHRCRGARVNGRLVSLTHPLKTGDQVEIITAKRGGGPSRDWLMADLGYVHTARARTKIRQWFRRQDRGQNVERGRELVEKELRRLGLDVKLEDVVALYHKDRDNPDEFYAKVGTGDIQPATIATRLAESAAPEEDLGLPPPQPAPLPTLDTTVRVMGVGDLLTNLARCCSPAPGDPIVGYITRGRGVTIHRQDCPNIVSSDEVDRMIPVSWGGVQKTYPVRVSIRAYDRPRLLQDIVEVIGDEDVSMSRAHIATHKERNQATFTVILELTDVSQLSRVLSRLEQVPSVQEARRIAG
jgi:guanosine-3',5'-bis(diphosphate) 3'-pyrophosphohydrolase